MVQIQFLVQSLQQVEVQVALHQHQVLEEMEEMVVQEVDQVILHQELLLQVQAILHQLVLHKVIMAEHQVQDQELWLVWVVAVVQEL
jgi:hypothetical protein